MPHELKRPYRFGGGALVASGSLFVVLTFLDFRAGPPPSNGAEILLYQALAMKMPADVYARSTRVYRGLEDLTYPFHDATFTVTQCGRICFKGRKVNLSHVFAGQNVGVSQVGERIWLVTFMQYDLGYFDDETCRLEPIDNPFGPKVLPMCSE